MSNNNIKKKSVLLVITTFLIIFISSVLLYFLFIQEDTNERIIKQKVEKLTEEKEKVIKPTVLIIYNNTIPTQLMRLLSDNFKVIPKNVNVVSDEDLYRSFYIIIINSNINNTNVIDDKLYSLYNKIIISGKSDNLKNSLKMVDYNDSDEWMIRDKYNVSFSFLEYNNKELGDPNQLIPSKFNCIGGSLKAIYNDKRIYACQRNNVIWISGDLEKWLRDGYDADFLKELIGKFFLYEGR
jgi:hypothetical protein